jgi:hypothetical protein
VAIGMAEQAGLKLCEAEFLLLQKPHRVAGLLSYVKESCLWDQT